MQTRRIIASLPMHDAYDIRVGAGIVSRLGSDLRSCAHTARAEQAVVITDANVGPLYADAVAASLRKAGLATHVLTIPAGEESKSVDVANELWQALVQLGCNRATVTVSLGGGVISDIAGFIAATYMRGIALVHVPTTLLGAIDASVGGKAALDLPQGKNLVGAFKQPEYVCIDLELLSSLPDEQWKSGLGELAKMAVITSDDFFFWLSDHAPMLVDARQAIAENPDVLAEAMTRAIVSKVDIVAADEYDESGVRAQLNYGHTLGHALEQCSGFAVPHGIAVAEGMRFAARLAAAVCALPLDAVQAQDSLLDMLAIPRISETPEVPDLLASMHADKKAAGGTIRFVLPTDIACCTLRDIDDNTLSSHLSAWAAQRKA